MHNLRGGGTFEKNKRKNLNIEVKEKNDSCCHTSAGSRCVNFKYDVLCFV